MNSQSQIDELIKKAKPSDPIENPYLKMRIAKEIEEQFLSSPLQKRRQLFSRLKWLFASLTTVSLVFSLWLWFSNSSILFNQQMAEQVSSDSSDVLAPSKNLDPSSFSANLEDISENIELYNAFSSGEIIDENASLETALNDWMVLAEKADDLESL